MTDQQIHNEDEALLAKLGYKQDLNRSWSGFSNFAISFSIISILAGCFTNFGAGFNNGGPISISWSWPILSVFILIIGFTMSELVSAYPTSGGIYWWASKLGGAKAGFFTGWLNLIGLVAVTAGVSYGCATFIDLTISTWSESFAANYSLRRVFIIFVIVLALAALLNIFSSHLMAIMNNVSVWWHVIGASAIVLILIFVPDQHQSFNYVFTERFNNTGYFDGQTASLSFWFVVVPFGFLLTQYTITGFDACAHLSEETTSASTGAAKGIWRSIFYSAVGGYILLLCVVFAIPDGADGNPDNAGVGSGGVAYIFNAALGQDWATLVLFISASAQFFCATSCLTSASRMTFAFSRDRAIPGSGIWSTSDREAGARERGPRRRGGSRDHHAARTHRDQHRGPRRPGVPVSGGVLRGDLCRGERPLPVLRDPDLPALAARRRFEVGEWNNGAKYKWMNIVAVIEIVVVVRVPVAAHGSSRKPVRWQHRLLVEVRQLLADPHFRRHPAAGDLVELSAKKWFTGPIHEHRSRRGGDARRLSWGTLSRTWTASPYWRGGPGASPISPAD